MVTVQANLDCLEKVLAYNVLHDISFFRITSDLIPFASHPVNNLPWQREFKNRIAAIGDMIHKYDMRVSMHPDQFVLINSPSEEIYYRSVAELSYHCDLLDLMGLEYEHKMQIHVGGVYGDKEKSIERFIQRYVALPARIKERLVIENDERMFSLSDCMRISGAVGVPVLFDVFHHALLNSREDLAVAFGQFTKTWKTPDGLPIIDYSSQEEEKRMGRHSDTIQVEDFERVLRETSKFDYDIMLEIKDKEVSALKAIDVVKRVFPAKFKGISTEEGSL
jgi:UV DNA damage endonuclease